MNPPKPWDELKIGDIALVAVPYNRFIGKCTNCVFHQGATIRGYRCSVMPCHTVTWMHKIDAVKIRLKGMA